MLRRHFITGEENPDFIITYYAPQHIPFSSNYKGVLRGFYGIDNFDNENNTVFTCVLDKWKDGVGEYGIKILNWVDGVWYNMWGYRKFVDLTNSNVGSLGVYIDIGNNVQEDIMLFSDTITDVIFPNEIKHLIGPAVSDYLDEYNRSVVNITLPENLETLSNHVLRSLHVLKTITIPSSVIYMGDNTLKIDCENDNIMGLAPGNQSLEEIIMKPIIPPSTGTFATPIGTYSTNRYINPNLKIRVYADCVDTYKNDTVWGQYSDLYDTINNAIVCYGDTGKREIYEHDDNIYEIKEWDVRDRYSRIYLPNSTHFIRNKAFRNFSLTDISMPSVTEIEESAFENSDLISINMPYVHKIGNNAFKYCRDLTSVTIAQQTSIGDSAFYACSSLKFITIPENLPQTGTNAFYYCKFGKNNIIGDYDKIKAAGAKIYDVETEDGYFINNYNIGKTFCGIRPYVKNAIISDDIDYITYSLESTVYDNDSLESIYIGKNVKGCLIGATQLTEMDLSLGHSDNIKSLKVDPLNPYYDSRNDCNAVIETATNTLLVGCPTTTIPNTVEIIKYNNAFKRIKIENLNIPLSVKKITDMYRADTYNYTKINTIIYEGTIEQWNAIEKTGTVYEQAAITIKCSDGEIKYFTHTNA